MIISRTPFRVSLFGGGTDYPSWFREHGGGVLGMAIDKYCYISVRPLPPFFEHKHRIVYSQIELVADIKDIRHPAVRSVLSEMNVENGLEIHYDADLPAWSGLGSSSAFTVGLINALHAADGRMISKKALGREAIRIEQEVIKECVGSQDQLWAAYGGLNRIDFSRDGNFSVSPIVLSSDRRSELMQSLLLVFTGFSRLAPQIAQDQVDNIKHRGRQLSRLREIVDEAMTIVVDDRTPVHELGRLLDQSWRLKRELADSVSNTEIDQIYETGLAAGATGGKLLGAGGGGFMVFVVDPERRQALQERLGNLIQVGLNLDDEGSKIVVYEPDGF